MLEYIMEMSRRQKTLEAKRKRLVGQIETIGPWIAGSLVSTSRICGKKNCACRRGGPKHPVTYVTWKEKGKTVSLYVPRRLEKEVSVWSENYKRLKELMKKVSEVQKQIIRLRPVESLKVEGED